MRFITIRKIASSAWVLLLGSLFSVSLHAQPTALRIVSQKSRISYQNVANAGTVLQIQTVDAQGQPTPNDQARTLVLRELGGLLNGNGTRPFPKDQTTLQLVLDGTAQSPLGLGNQAGTLQMQASFAELSTLVSNVLPLSLVGPYLQAVTQAGFSNASPAGALIPAFQVTRDDGSVLADTELRVAHYTAGIGSVPLEVIPSTRTAADGSLSLRFTQASGRIAAASGEYYVISDVNGVLADALVPNVGNNTQADIVLGQPAQVRLLDGNHNPQQTLTATAVSGGWLAQLATQQLQVLDAAANPLTMLTPVINLAASRSQVGGLLSATGTGIQISYNSLLRDQLTLAFSSPANLPPLALTVLAPDADPLLTPLSLDFNYQVSNSPDLLFAGGSRIDSGSRQSAVYAPAQARVYSRCQVLPASADVGKTAQAVLLLYWQNPYGQILWWDMGANQAWNGDLSQLGRWGNPLSLGTGVLTLLDINLRYDAFGAGSTLMWVSGYRVDGSALLHVTPLYISLNAP